MSKQNVKASKALSWLLRHGAVKEGLSISSEGWVLVDDVLKYRNLKNVSVERLMNIVKNCPKQRFALKEEGGQLLIRANQGHTIQEISPDLQEITDPADIPTVIHGTYYPSWSKIREEGLSCMKRTHIHFAPGKPEEAGVISGMRSSCTVYISIDAAKAMEDGYQFFRSANNVILCAGNEEGFLLPKYFLAVTDAKTGGNLL